MGALSIVPAHADMNGDGDREKIVAKAKVLATTFRVRTSLGEIQRFNSIAFDNALSFHGISSQRFGDRVGCSKAYVQRWRDADRPETLPSAYEDMALQWDDTAKVVETYRSTRASMLEYHKHAPGLNPREHVSLLLQALAAFDKAIGDGDIPVLKACSRTLRQRVDALEADIDARFAKGE